MFTKSKRRTRLSAIALSVGLIATACGGGASDEAATAAEPAAEATAAPEAVEEAGGAGLPQLIGDTVAGGQIDTNDLAGQDIVVWFWAPW